MRIRWGWLEWFIVSQTAMPALAFVPGVSSTPSVRVVTRVAAYAIALLAWVMIAWRGRTSVGVTTFPAQTWLLCVIGWLTLSIAHPGIYSIGAATTQVMLYIAVLSPAFWAEQALESPKQINRVMALLLSCTALSALVGMGQVYYPERFNPPYIPAMHGIFQGEDLMYEGPGGRKIIRPCGLTDSPGAAASAGATAALIGLCWALRPVATWKRLGAAGLAFIGVAVIYYSQVRSQMVMLAIGVVSLMSILIYQGSIHSALSLVSGGVAIVIGSLYWVSWTIGSRATERFGTLLGSDPANLFLRSRGGYVVEAFERFIWDYPLGYGMGWWGMTHMMFADPARISPVWVEVMIPGWIFDGGAPLLFLYSGALVVALADSVRIAVTCQDRNVAFWAAVISAYNLSIIANCFSYVTFVSSLGPLFWLFAAMLHAADAQTRAVAPRLVPVRPRVRPWPWSPGTAAR